MNRLPTKLGSKSDTIEEQFRTALLNGEIPAGDRIVLDQWRVRLGVSLSPMREALSRLVSVGLVEVDQMKGFRASKISAEQLLEIVWLRRTIEPIALRRAIEMGDPAWEANIVATRHRLELLLPSGKTTPRNKVDPDWEYWHRRFHVALLEGCKSPLLVQFCIGLHEAMDRYRRTLVNQSLERLGDGKSNGNAVKQRAKQSRLRKSVEPFHRDVRTEHKELSEAVLEHDVERACKIMDLHIVRTGERLLKMFDDVQDPIDKRASPK